MDIPQSDNPVTVLTEEQSYELLSSATFGRLVVRRATEVDIFPINYIVDKERNIYFRTAEGSKLFTVSLNPDVVLEADLLNEEESYAWSVVVRGQAAKVQSSEEYGYADSLPLKPLVPTLKYNYVRIEVDEISGRHFRLSVEPERF